MKKQLIVGAWLMAAGALPLRLAAAGLTEALNASYAAEAKKDIPAALRAVKEIENQEAGNYIIQLRLGWLYYLSGLYNESVDYYKKAAQLSPQAVEPLMGMTYPLGAAGKNDDLLRAYQRVLGIDPHNYTALSRLAWLTYLKKDYAKAADAYRKLVDLYPTDVEMLLGLGYSLKMSGKTSDAQAYFNKALLLSPKNPRALEGLK